MAKFIKENNNKITLEISNLEELKAYQLGLLHILGKIEIQSQDEVLRHSLKSIYQLLSLLASHNALLTPTKSNV